MKSTNTNHITVGVVGLGLMGSGFIVTLLMAGHRVIAIAPLPVDLETAPERICCQLAQCDKLGLLDRPLESYLQQLTFSEDYSKLVPCDIVLECVVEMAGIKKSVYEKIEAVVRPDTVIASNTSAIPISNLQEYFRIPGRFLGIHWAEPAYLTRFMEIICGEKTDKAYAHWVYEMAHHWGKEPTLLRKDIRGFITNRLMYAAYREGLHLVEKGEATLDDIDKAFRYDAGSWMTLMGVFRRMDLEGLKNYFEVYKTIFPKLCNSGVIPPVMQEMVDTDARGTRNCRGLYTYTKEEAEKWEEAFRLFNEDIYELAVQYPSSPVR